MNMYFVKQNIPVANLKIVNNYGEELSLSGDDACGTSKQYSRFCMAKFSDETRSAMLGEEVLAPSAEDFLKALAEHLGFQVTKKRDMNEEEDSYGEKHCLKCHKSLYKFHEKESGVCDQCGIY